MVQAWGLVFIPNVEGGHEHVHKNAQFGNQAVRHHTNANRAVVDLINVFVGLGPLLLPSILALLTRI